MNARLFATATLALLAAGCQGSGRFSDFGGGPRTPAAAAATRPAPLAPAPTSPVQSAPLPPSSSQPLPPPGVPAPAPPAASGGLPPIGSSVAIETPDGGAPRVRRAQPIDPEPVTEPPPEPARPQVAARSEPAAPSGPPTRTSVTGNWTAREAAGGSCRVTLSSSPTLDLYRASTNGCQSRELKGVNAWELRGDEVYLYEAGGGVAARLKSSGGRFEGSASRTGAPITLSK
ncbi:MAG: AprI/Inh family metalloprotease inhibitor [Beijerinckiaceae bacterium]